MKREMDDSDYEAIQVALDELISYLEIAKEASGNEEKLRWVIRKLQEILSRRLEELSTDATLLPPREM